VAGVTQQFTADKLLAWHDAATVVVPHDPSYGPTMSYLAVPLSGLLSALPPDASDTIQARAIDGFVAELPRTLIGGAAVPWLAVEDPAHPWPHLPGKNVSAGPFYLVWQDPERAGISTEQWPYALAALSAVPSLQSNVGRRLRSLRMFRWTLQRGAGKQFSSPTA
jgi:hypothetical protein